MDDSRTNKLYRNILTSDWNAVTEELLSCMEEVNQVNLLTGPISVYGDSIIHLVVHSGTVEPLKQILCCDTLKDDPWMLHCFTMSVNNYGNTVLHEAAISGNLAAVKLLVEKKKELLVKGNYSNETPLFKAAAFGKTKIVKFLASCKGQTDDDTKQLKDIHRKNKNGETVLFAAVQGKHFGTALELLKIDEKLTELEDGNQISFNMLAQIPSALTQYELSIWKKLVFFCVPVGCDHNDDSDEIESKYKDIESCLHRKGLLVGCDDNEENKDQDIESGLHQKVGSDRNREMEEGDIKCGLTRLCHTFFAVLYNIYLSIWTRIIRVFPLAKKIWKEKRDHAFAWELAKKLMVKYLSENLKRFVFKVEKPTGNQLFDAIISRNVEAVTLALNNYPQQLEELKILNLATEEEESEQGNTLFAAIRTGNVERVKLTLENYPEQLDLLNLKIQKVLYEDANPLLSAIRAGNVEVVKLILKEYPQALEQIKINKNRNILHVAAMYRQKEIFHVVKTKKILMIRLARQIDDDGYTILHSVADTQHYKGGTRLGPAYELQEELKWFDRVKEIMPSSYNMLRAKNKTALEILEKKHVEQLKKAQSWIKETSQSCSAVAVLVATVVFAAAFTVPGGTNDNDGIPILLHSPYFVSFTFLDVVSLSCSLTSVVMFLSILTSPFELDDFRASLPRKLTFGFMLLFISVAATMLTFTSTIVLIIRLYKDRKFPMILLCSAAFCPVFMLALTHFPLIFSFIKDWVSSVNQKILRCLRFFGNQCIKI